MTMNKWSQTASSNATADSTINLREGQSPGSLNDAARGMMAAISKFRDDLSGNLVTGGTSTAYTVTTNQGFAALTDGLYVVARIHATSGATPTFAPDGLTAKQIRDVYGTSIETGALVLGGVYGFVYDSTDDAWIVPGRFGDTLTSTNNPDLVAIEALSTTGAARRTASNTWALDKVTTTLNFAKDNAGIVLSTGVQGDFSCDFDCTITGVKVLADQSGSIVLDLYKVAYASFPGTNSNSICASAKPTLSSASKYSDTTLTGWTTSVSAGDTIRVNVDSVSTITRFTLALKVNRYA